MFSPGKPEEIDFRLTEDENERKENINAYF
jgi:hypothetical protein